MDFEASRARAEELTQRLLEFQDAYYRRDEIVVSDAEYDVLLRELEGLEAPTPNFRALIRRREISVLGEGSCSPR